MSPELCARCGAPMWLHPDDLPVWHLTHNSEPDGELADGQVITVAGTDLHVLLTPGHSPGSVCLYAPDLGVVFSGDTLVNGGPGATGRSFSHRPTIEASIRDRLFALPDETIVKTGQGADTTIGAERVRLDG